MSTSIRNLFSAKDISAELAHKIFKVARSLEVSLKNQTALSVLSGKTCVNLFFENSTRTRMSFELAIRKLGGNVLNFTAGSSSTQKGETLIDTAKNIEAMRPHALIVRHSSGGSPYVLSKYVSIPIVNAGDGFHQHPTQALLDAFTMLSHFGSLEGKKVLILGDIAHSRVARSNIDLLKTLGAKIIVCGPPTLMPPEPKALGVEVALRPEDVLSSVDVVMALRMQLERQNSMQIPSLGEYTAIWGLSVEREALLKNEAIILHPGPINRGVEISPEVADGRRSVILDQVFNGVLIRMAVLTWILKPEEFEKWAK